MAKRHSMESLFEAEALAAGFQVKQPQSIRIDTPVENSNGKKGKVVTTPDFFLVNLENGKGGHVEIVNGKGNGEHKAAQMRVVEKAGVKNYSRITGHQITEIAETETVAEKKSLFLQIFHWLICL